MAPLMLHLRGELIESNLMPRNLEEVVEEFLQTTFLILNQCQVAMMEGKKILQEFGVSVWTNSIEFSTTMDRLF